MSVMNNTTTHTVQSVPPSPHRPIPCPGGWLSGDDHDFDPHTEGYVMPWHVMGDDREAVVICAGCATPAVERSDYRTMDEMMADDRWGGYGFLGGYATATRGTKHDRPTWLVELVVGSVYTAAYAAGWESDDLFSWANSRTGRHFADAVFFDYAGIPTRQDAYRQLTLAFTHSFALPED